MGLEESIFMPATVESTQPPTRAAPIMMPVNSSPFMSQICGKLHPADTLVGLLREHWWRQVAIAERSRRDPDEIGKPSRAPGDRRPAIAAEPTDLWRIHGRTIFRGIAVGTDDLRR